MEAHPWLAGPKGKTTGIGADFFKELAEEESLCIRSGAGLLTNFSLLDGGGCRVQHVDPVVAHFYEHTAEYELEAWSEWSGVFKPFGWLLARMFSRRLQQLNVPLSGLDTSRGITSQVISLADHAGNIHYTAWVRQLLNSRHVLYAGSYSICSPPGHPGMCVKVVFPLPNGNAIVIMFPESFPDGSFRLTSSGNKFGDPGFYFTVHGGGNVWARYVRTMRETITVYRAQEGDVRADHMLTLWGAVFLRLHYRLRRTRKDGPAGPAIQ